MLSPVQVMPNAPANAPASNASPTFLLSVLMMRSFSMSDGQPQRAQRLEGRRALERVQ
jgi:hypothetical protein